MAERRVIATVAPVLLIVALFYLWGIANNLNDILIPQFRKAFTLNDWQSALVQSAFYMGYFLLALPASMMMRRYGYKAAVVTGLLLYGAGALLFYPAGELRTYGLFLGALFIIASGLAFLETSANPLMLVMGPPEGAARRLNFAQAFNPGGSITGVFIGRQFILTGHEPTAVQLAAMSPAALEQFHITEAHAAQIPYLVLAAVVLAWAALVAITPFPDVATEGREAATSEKMELGALLRRRQFLFGVVAQFFYVGAQVTIWSFMIRFGQAEVPGLGEKAAADVLFWSLCATFAGRFIGTALMGAIRPALLLLAFNAINIVLVGYAIMAGGWNGLMALAATSFFMSISFPTIFALAVKDLGPLTKTASSFVVMSIIGGGILPPLVGWLSHETSIRNAMMLPACCFAIVAIFAIGTLRPASAIARAA